MYIDLILCIDGAKNMKVWYLSYMQIAKEPGKHMQLCGNIIHHNSDVFRRSSAVHYFLHTIVKKLSESQQDINNYYIRSFSTIVANSIRALQKKIIMWIYAIYSPFLINFRWIVVLTFPFLALHARARTRSARARLTQSSSAYPHASRAALTLTPAHGNMATEVRCRLSHTRDTCMRRHRFFQYLSQGETLTVEEERFLFIVFL